MTQGTDFIIHSTDNQQNIIEDVKFWLDFDKPLIQSSDAHNIEQISTKYTWLKADTTFEGLKQIIYEPEERVKIQEANPAFDFEKSPFIEIQINENVEVFESEKDNVTFEKCTLPLNNGMVSIIGGRGTGKSILIDYISAGLGQNIKKKNYTKSDKITIKRQTSLKDEATSFVISDNPNIQFMYISQSEIKNIVENSQEFTKNIRETIGVIDNYIVSREYKEKADRYINEYFGVVKILEADNTSSLQKKNNIDNEIKRYNDFITNITSQENKPKLENYQKHLNDLANRKAFYDKLQSQKTAIEQFQNDTNNNLRKLNESLSKRNLNIPLINNTVTINYISQTALPKVQQLINDVESEIQKIKDTFAGYTGDLATLLSDVAQYQKKATELQRQKKNIEDNETTFVTIKQNYFKELGSEIENSINTYKQEIVNKWNNFKNGSTDYSKEQKQLLSDILGTDNLNVSIEINFDTEKMYQLLMQKLDGRSWNTEKLKQILNINNLEDYVSFIKQTAEINTFSDQINSIKSYVLDVFFRKYNEFIIHNIVVTSQNKNITKLSHGQQGTIYLRLKLAANLFSKTIIYDQPEDDLDNEFIMSDLVSIFRKIKKYRQVIIVSHNANLVVNADSEQVIIAQNEDGVLKYVSGSLENKYINEQICKILEGGKSAFLDREKKYGFKK
jgi:DNA repair ATPase RecN